MKRISFANKYFLASIFFVFGVLLTSVALVYADNANSINACVSIAGILRIPKNGTCRKDEKPLQWNIQGPQGVPGPTGVPGPQGSAGGILGSAYICPGCNFTDNGLIGTVPNFFAGKDLSNAYIPAINLGNAHVNLQNTNFSNAVMVQAFLQTAQASGANFSNAQLEVANFSNANLSNANLTGTNLQGASFSYADLTNANFSNANLSDFIIPPTVGSGTSHADFTGAVLTGVIWSNTICPDGTNSDNDPNHTCVGHF